MKDKQYALNVELDSYTDADHQYHIHVSTVLNLSSRIADIFDSSELEEKRAILGFVLQNPTLNGRQFNFTLKKPFNLVLSLAYAQRKNRALDPASSIWRGLRDDFRTDNFWEGWDFDIKMMKILLSS